MGEYIPRWTVIAVGVPLASGFDFGAVWPPVRALMLAGLAYAAFSLSASPDRLGGALELYFLLVLCGAFVLGAELATLDDVMEGLALGIGVSSLLCVAQALGWEGVPQASVPAGLFYSRELLAEFAAPVALWAVVAKRPWLLLLTLPPILLCHSRVAVLALAVGLLFAFRPRSKTIFAALAVLIAVSGFAAMLALGPEKFHNAGLRLTIWGATAMAVTPFGNGLGWFHAAHPIEDYAHSDVLQAVAEMGVGSAFFLAVMPLAFWRNGSDRGVRCAFVAVCIEAFVSFPLHMPATGFLAAVCAGHLCGARRGLRLGQHHGGDEDGAGVQRRASARGVAAV